MLTIIILILLLLLLLNIIIQQIISTNNTTNNTNHSKASALRVLASPLPLGSQHTHAKVTTNNRLYPNAY